MWATTDTGGNRGNGVAMLVPISATNIPTDLVVHIQSEYPYFFRAYNIMGQPIFDSYLPDGTGTKTATLDYTNYAVSFPAWLSIEVLDGVSMQSNNMIRVNLTGGNVFKVITTYGDTMPIAEGWIQANVDGSRQLVKADAIQELAWGGTVIETRGDQ